MYNTKYEDHNYIKEIYIKEKFKGSLYQKIDFTETYIQYPTLSYNEIILTLIDKFDVEHIKYTPNQINLFKSNYRKKIIWQPECI